MEISGIMKLRFAVTFLFLLMCLQFFLIISASDIDYDAEIKFYDSLSENEIDTLVDIYEKYPETDTYSSYELAGYLIYFVTGGLFILMIKVWKTKQISSDDRYDIIEHLYDNTDSNKNVNNREYQKDNIFKTTEENDLEERQRLRDEMT